MSMQMFVTYAEVFGHRPQTADVSALIASLNKKDTFFLLSMINNFLALFPPSFDENKFVHIQRFLSQELFEKDTYEQLRRFLEGVSLISRPVFHRASVLLFMKRVLLEGQDEGGIEPGKDIKARQLIGEICLKLNDFAVSEEQEQRTQSDSPLEDAESERILNELLVQMLPTTELMNPPEFSSAMGRTKQYIDISESRDTTLFDGKTLSAFFESKTGISLERFLHMTVGIYGALVIHDVEDLIKNPANFNISKSAHFGNLDYKESEIDAFFDMTAKGFEALVSELAESPLRENLLQQYDYTVFRKFPLFHLSEDIISVEDVSFLIEKASFGLYHTILNVLKDAGENPEVFFRHWGYVFEEYVNGIFRTIFPEMSHRFHANAQFDSKTEMEAFDGIIEYPSSIIAMEYKSGLLNATAKYSGDAEALLSDMGKKFGRASNRAGIKQLATKIELLFHSDPNKRVKLRSGEFPNIRNIFPVLIVNELSLEFGLAHWRLRLWFEQELTERAVDSSVKVNPLMILTIEDVERIAPYLEAEDFTFLDFAQYYSQLEYIRFSWFLIREHWYEPMTTIGQVFSRFRKKNNIEHRMNQRIFDEWTKQIEKIMVSFKPEHLSSEDRRLISKIGTDK